MVLPRPLIRNESEEPTLRLAVLIDADNAQAAVIEGLLEEIARYGEATVGRQLTSWFTCDLLCSARKVALATFNNFTE